MPTGSADAVYRQVIEVEGAQAGAEIEAFRKQLASMESVTADLQRQFAAVTAAARRMASETAEARSKAAEAAQADDLREQASKAKAAAEVLAAAERAAFEASLEAMRAAGEKFEAARVKARADAQAQIDKIDADARLTAEQRAIATANIRKALEERLTAIALQETQHREALAEREARAQEKAAARASNQTEKSLTKLRGLIGSLGVASSSLTGTFGAIGQAALEAFNQIGPFALAAAGGVYGLTQAIEYLQLQARRTAAEELLGLDLATADAVAEAFGDIGSAGALALARVSKEAKLTRAEMAALAVAAQQAARISGRSVAEEMEAGLKRLGLTISGVEQRYEEFIASLEEKTPGEQIFSDKEIKQQEEAIRLNERAAADLRREIERLTRAFELANRFGRESAISFSRQILQRTEELRGLEALIQSQQAGLAQAFVRRFDADVESMHRTAIGEIERLGAAALTDRQRIEAEYAETLRRFSNLAFTDAETFNRLQIAAAELRTKRLADLAKQERADRIAALQAVAAAERALAQEQAALALGQVKFRQALLGEDASATERHAATLAVIDQEAANARAEAEADANQRIAALRNDDRLNAEQRSAAIAAEEQALAAKLERIGVEANAARVEAHRAFLNERKAQTQAYVDWAAAQEAAVSNAVDAEAGAQIVAVRRLADERVEAARAAAREGLITAEELSATEKRIAAETTAEIERIRKESAQRQRQQRLKELRDATEVLPRGTLDSLLLSIGMTEEAVEQLRLRFVQMGEDGAAAWGALGAAAEAGALAMQAATAAVRQSISDWILDNKYAQEIAVRDIQDRLLQQDEAYQEIVRQLATETDAKRRASLEARRAGLEERAYAKAKKQAAAEAEVAQKKQLASIVASIAAESAVRAIYEGALALASLAIGDFRGASLHGAAAAAFASIGGIAAAVAGGISSSASREELALAERRREEERRRQELESDRATRRSSALRAASDGGGFNLTIQFVGSAFVTQAEVGRAVEQALKAWEAQR